jgi:hypothetical protein
MDRCLSCGHPRAEHWPALAAPRSEAERRGALELETLYAHVDGLAGAEGEWPADGESACKVCHCSYYLGVTDVTEWKRLVEGGADP